jgi:mono/diheme cytochrome c family protein
VKSLGTLFKTVGSLVPVVAVSAYVGATALSPTAVEGPQAEPPGDVARGRALVIEHACGDCHGGGANPAADGWLAGMRAPEQEFTIPPSGGFKTRPRNLTPDNITGIGRFSDRQIFNAIRYGLRPGETPDVDITSSTPGQGNFPSHPKYLAPPMPWPAFRHMEDQDIWDIAAYLKRGVKPVRNLVKDSEGPPDFWASGYVVENIGPYPAPAFPAVNEVAQR